jgi:hypothetical protein
MNASRTATANWKAQSLVSFTSTPSNGGSTNPAVANTWIDQGEFTIRATPNSGYLFSTWSSNTDGITFLDATSASTTTSVIGTGTINANFVVQPTPTPIPTSTPTPTLTSTSTPKPTIPPSPTPKPTPLPIATLTPTAMPAIPTPTPSLSTIQSPSPSIPEFPSAIAVSILAVAILIILSIFRKKT